VDWRKKEEWRTLMESSSAVAQFLGVALARLVAEG